MPNVVYSATFLEIHEGFSPIEAEALTGSFHQAQINTQSANYALNNNTQLSNLISVSPDTHWLRAGLNALLERFRKPILAVPADESYCNREVASAIGLPPTKHNVIAYVDPTQLSTIYFCQRWFNELSETQKVEVVLHELYHTTNHVSHSLDEPSADLIAFFIQQAEVWRPVDFDTSYLYQAIATPDVWERDWKATSFRAYSYVNFLRALHNHHHDTDHKYLQPSEPLLPPSPFDFSKVVELAQCFGNWSYTQCNFHNYTIQIFSKDPVSYQSLLEGELDNKLIGPRDKFNTLHFHLGEAQHIEMVINLDNEPKDYLLNTQDYVFGHLLRPFIQSNTP